MMTHNAPPQPTKLHRAQRGFSLVAVMFLIIVVAGTIAFMARMASVAAATNDLALLSSRAMQAARAGIDFQAHQILQGGSFTCANSTLDLSTDSALKGFSVVTSCSQKGNVGAGANLRFQDGSTKVFIYEVSAVASYGGSTAYDNNGDYVYRRLDAVFSREEL